MTRRHGGRVSGPHVAPDQPTVQRVLVVVVGVLMMVYVLFGGMTATTWVIMAK